MHGVMLKHSKGGEIMQERVYNFSAGPSTLPLEALEEAAKDMCNYQGLGLSVMEMSHRSKAYGVIIEEAKSLLRELMNIPDTYEVLFLQGGASTQFAMIPLNLFTKKKAYYVDTGAWSKKAIAEAKKYGEVVVVDSSSEATYNYIPKVDFDALEDDGDYVYITSNNTIYGTRYKDFPKLKNMPLIADMSSDILSREIDVNDFGIIFAGAQKNMGPAGVTVVIMKKDLIGKPLEFTPTMLTYSTHSEKDSMFNTPPTYSIYMLMLVLKQLKANGGIPAMEKLNIDKAELLYSYLDSSDVFSATVEGDDRSLMNIPFVTGNKDWDKDFIAYAEDKGLINLKGHRSVGGMRASIYNAMSLEGVKALIQCMKEFEENLRTGDQVEEGC